MKDKKDIVILGLNFGLHDSSAAIFINDRIVAACEEERFNRIKHTTVFPYHAIKFVLDKANITFDQITDVAYYWNTHGRFYERFKFQFKEISKRLVNPLKLSRYLYGNVWLRTSYNIAEMMFPKATLKKYFPNEKHNYNLKTITHHDTHAACAYYPSGFNEAAIVIVDGSGELESTSLYYGKDNSIQLIERQYLPHSLGVFYGAITEYLGFQKHDAEYKVMGLASYGKPNFIDKMREILVYKGGINFELIDDYFDFQYGSSVWYSKKFVDFFGHARKQDEDINDRFKDIAASAQLRLEEVLTKVCSYSLNKLGVNNLCMAGGVALNCSANSKIAEAVKPAKFYIHPASSDAGTSLGAALWLAREKYDVRHLSLDSPFLGPDFSGDEIEKYLKRDDIRYKKHDSVESILAKYLYDGKICCRFNGSMEWGPRALGNRSILANPSKAGVRNEINLKVKLREEFRPFAPSCLDEDFNTYFEGERNFYMLVTNKVKEITKEKLPAIVHVDNTSRVQVVTEKINPSYYRLLKEFKKLSGYGVLLNTSFNVQEPIVCTPKDAINTFCKSKMDFLCIGDYIVERV